MTEPKQYYSPYLGKDECYEAVKNSIDDSILAKRIDIRLAELARISYNIEDSVRSIKLVLRFIAVVLCLLLFVGVSIIK